MKKNKLFYLPTLLVLAIIVFEMSSDIYLPSMPEMALFFGVPDHQVVLTISLYMIAFSVMGLVGGSLSDHFGRRPVYLWGLVIFALASLGSLLAPDIQTLILFRIFQGMGAGISYVISTAMIKDSHSDEQCSKLFSIMGMAIAISPTVAPILGSYITSYFGWSMNFYIISVAAFLIWGISQLFIIETLTLEKRQQLNFKHSFKTYGLLFSKLSVTGNALISGMTYGSLWAWITLAPFYFIDTLGQKPQDYAAFGAIGPISYMIGALLNQLLVTRYGIPKMLRLGLTINIVGSILINLVSLYFPQSIPLIVITLMFFCIGLAPVFSNAATRSLDVPASQLGAASAVLALIEMVLAGFYSYLVGWLNNGTLYPATLTMLLSSVGCVALYWLIRQNKKYQGNKVSS
ncbi:MAG: multidrug effflux MFS transporter [Candidatus Paracaedibacteraceae bacterium]|nr:multidrug effflux MFS transporter [Candidatus Paracaedibacteraceae bacterium]